MHEVLRYRRRHAIGRQQPARKEARRPVSKSSTNPIPIPRPAKSSFREFFEPFGLTQSSLARAIGAPPRRINEIVLGKRAVTADTAPRPARCFGVSKSFWLGVQADYELMERRRAIGAELDRIAPHSTAA
jgi:addiction module HigA family antidote